MRTYLETGKNHAILVESDAPKESMTKEKIIESLEKEGIGIVVGSDPKQNKRTVVRPRR